MNGRLFCDTDRRPMDDVLVVPYEAGHRAVALDVAIRSWEPVFQLVRESVPRFVYENFYPEGWRTRQIADLAQVLDEEPSNVDVAMEGGTVVGWVCTRLHPEDSMGEIYVITVAPEHQRQGVGRVLMQHAHDRVRQAGMRMIMVETGGDPGHAPARAAYEAAGYQRWPVARYFKDLAQTRT